MSFRIGCKNNKIGPAARFQKVMQNGKPAKMNSVIVDSDTVVISCPGGLVVEIDEQGSVVQMCSLSHARYSNLGEI